MPFNSLQSTSCTAYDEKTDLCFPCTDPIKRKECMNLYKLYKNAKTPSEQLTRRLEYYHAGCVDPRCYDMRHCKYLETLDKKNVSVQKFCTTASKNVFIPRDYKTLSQLSVDQLESILKNLNVCPENFRVNVRRVLDEQYTALVQQLKSSNYLVSDHECRTMAAQDEIKLVESEIEPLERQIQEMVNRRQELAAVLEDRQRIVDLSARELSTILPEVDRYNDEISRIESLLTRVSTIGALEEVVVEDVVEEEKEENGGVGELMEEKEPVVPIVKKKVSKLEQEVGRVMDQTFPYPTEEQSLVTLQKINTEFYDNYSGNTFRSLFVFHPDVLRENMRAKIQEYLKNYVLLYVTIYLMFSSSEGADAERCGYFLDFLFRASVYVQNDNADIIPMLQDIESITDADRLDVVENLDERQNISKTIKLIKNNLYNAQYMPNGDIGFVMKDKVITLDSLPAFRTMYAEFAIFNSILVYNANSLIAANLQFYRKRAVDIVRSTDCTLYAYDISVIQNYLFDVCLNDIIRTKQFYTFFQRECAGEEIHYIFQHTCAFSIISLLYKTATKTHGDTPLQEICYRVLGTVDVDDVFNRWDVHYVPMLSDKIKKAKNLSWSPAHKSYQVMVKYLDPISAQLRAFVGILDKIVVE